MQYINYKLISNKCPENESWECSLLQQVPEKGFEKACFSIWYVGTGAVTQSGPCFGLPLTLIMSSGPLWSGKNPREEPGDDVARGKNVAKWMSIHFSLIHNPYLLNDPSPLPFPRRVATGRCSFFPLPPKYQCPLVFCHLLAFSLLHLIFFPLGALHSCSLLGLELSLSLCPVFKRLPMSLSPALTICLSTEGLDLYPYLPPGHRPLDIP